MKKRIAVLCVISMLISLVTMPVSACDDCKVLCDENYETVTSPDYTANKADDANESVIATVDSSDYVYYGLGSKVAEIKSDTKKHYGLNTKFEMSENIQSGLYNGAGYTVDMSFDIRLSESGSKMRVLAEGSDSFDTGNNVMALEITAAKKAIYYSRATTTVVEKKSLDAFFDTEKTDENHFYRVRFVFYVNNDEGTPVNYCDVYIDGHKVFENKEYAQNKKQRFIRALCIAPSTDPNTVINIGTVDNLNVKSYGADNKVDFDVAAQKDNLLANIRTAGAVLKNEEISENAKAVLTTAIQTAIEKYVSAATDFSEATATLKAAVEEAEKSTEIPEGPTDPGPDTPVVPDEPEDSEDEFSYIVKNDFETESKIPFTEVEIDIPIVEDNTVFINKAWKMTGKMALLSDVFEETNILNSSEEPKGSDCIVEFDIKFDNLCEVNSNFAITQLYDQTPDGTQIACLTFQKGNVNKMDGGGKTETTIGTNIFEDDVWYRVRIVQHMVNDDGTFPQDMSLYIDGEPVMEHFARRSRTATKAKLFNQVKLTGLGDDVVAYIDNFEIYKTSYSKADEPLDLGKNMKIVRKMQNFINTAKTGYEFGEYDPEDYDAVKTAYDEAVLKIPQFADQAEADLQAETLTTLFGSVKPNQGKAWVDSVAYSETDLKEATVVNANIEVSTSRMADATNDILALSVLYRKSAEYPAGEMLFIASDTATLTNKATATLNTSIDLSGYTDREALYIKTYVLTGENFTNELSQGNADIGTNEYGNQVVDEMYDETADIFKKELPDKTPYFSFSAVTEPDDRIMTFVTKEENIVASNLGKIEQNNAKDKLVYFNISNADNDGEYNVAFNPAVEGTYRVVSYSHKNGKIYDDTCTYLNSTSLAQKISDLKSGSATIRNLKQEMDLDIPLFDNCVSAGIEMNAVTSEVFADGKGDTIYEFKTRYLKYMDLLYNVKTAQNLDSVVKTLEEHGYGNTNNAYIWNQVCEHVYQNRLMVTNPSKLKELLNTNFYIVNTTPGLSSGGGGGGGGGFATTAKVDQTLSEAETPYEKNGNIFSDISQVSWAEEAIIFLAKNNIINGKADGIFAPNDNITREEFAKIVANTFGTGKDSEIPYFTDVDTQSWYYPYIKMVYADGIAKGIADGTFGIGMHISREDAIVMLYRAGNLKGVSYSDKAEFIPFEDGCSSYAEEAVAAFAKSGIISGTGNNMLNAGRTLTRAEAAQMVYGLYAFINYNNAD